MHGKKALKLGRLTVFANTVFIKKIHGKVMTRKMKKKVTCITRFSFVP